MHRGLTEFQLSLTYRRGIKWGTNIHDLCDMKYFGTDSCPEVKRYKRENEDLTWEGIEIIGITYGFWQNKFYDVRISILGSKNWIGLKDAIFARFGGGSQPDKNEETYFWVEKCEANILLKYYTNIEVGRLLFISNEIQEQKNTFERGQKEE